MFKVNDYVVYNAMGIYKIVDIRNDKDLSDCVIEYYVMEPAFGKNMTIKTPVKNPRVLMRAVLTKDNVLSLLARKPEAENVWILDNRKRSQNFKEALKSGECEEWIKLIKTLNLERQEKFQIGKKLQKLDADILKAAEKNLNEEFAIALNISPGEVPSFIHEHIS
ncbi:MAG: CarD-like transcriptional regulator [Bacillales bacterium]|jgi:CarD family transcriptional regulator|nr:CarD-like transcriptional regulator [Bacillales bacterium]